MIKIGETYVLHEDPDGKFDQIVERWHSLDLMRTVSDPPAAKVYRGKNLLFPNYPSLPVPRINQIVIPTGATRWSYGLFVATESQKNAILTETATSTDFKIKIEFTADDSSRDPAGGIKPFRIWMHPLQPRPLSPRPPAGNVATPSAAEDLWLIPFVDRRYWWQYKSVEKMSAESFSTVEAFVDWLEFKIDATIMLNCLNSKYNVIPDIVKNNDNENAAVILETLAWHIGCQLVPEVNVTVPGGQEETYGRNYALVSVEESPLIYAKNLEGKIGLRPCVRANVGQPTESVTIPANGWENVGKPSILMGGEYQDSGRQLPEKVLIKGKSSYQEKTATAAGITVPTVPKAAAVLRLTYTGADTVAADLATRIAKDYYGRFAKLYDYTFVGVQVWQPTVFDDCVIVFQQKYQPIIRESDAFAIANYGKFRIQTRVRGWISNLRPESPETGAVVEDTPTTPPSEFTCGDCLACLSDEDPDIHSDCALADPSPNSWWLYDDASNCCDNVADSNIEMVHDAGCLWVSEERECKERFIEESFLDPGAADVDEQIFHRWELELDGDWVVLTHKWYRKT